MKIRLLPALSAFAAFCILPAHAALLSFQTGETLVPGNTLSGTVTFEGWSNLTSGRLGSGVYGSHNSTAAWPSAIAANEGTGTSSFGKSSGYGYAASSSIHQGASTADVLPGGVFFLNASAIDGLQTVVFQIRATDRNEAVFSAAPTLTFGATTLAADFTSLYQTQDNYSAGFGGQDMDWYAFQWNLAGQSITSGTALSVNWTGLANSGIFELQLNQGSVYAQVVPEAGSAALLMVGGMAGLMRRRRTAGI